MFATYLSAFGRFSHDVRMYLITSFAIGFSYIGIVAVLFNLYLLRVGYGPVFIGWVAGSTALAHTAILSTSLASSQPSLRS